MNEQEYVLNEINKGIKMGMDSISTVSEKIGDKEFKDELLFQYNGYNDILNKVNSELEKHDLFPQELNPMQKTMGWFEIQKDTIVDKSNEHIASMMIKGTNMGIVEGIQLLNNNKDAIDKNTTNLLNEFIQFQENSVEKLKKYL